MTLLAGIFTFIKTTVVPYLPELGTRQLLSFATTCYGFYEHVVYI